MPLIKLGIQLLLIAEEHTQLYSSFLQVVHSNSRSSGSWFISAVRLLEYRTTYGVNCVWPASTNQKRPFSLYLTIVYLIISKSLNLAKNAIKKLLLTRWGRSTTNITTSSFGTEGLNIFLKFWDLSGAKECKFCRSRKMQQNELLVAIVAVDTAENEPLKVWEWFHSLFIRLLRNFSPDVGWRIRSCGAGLLNSFDAVSLDKRTC